VGRCHHCNIGCITATHQLGVLSITPLAPCPGHMHQVHNHKSPLLALSAPGCCTTLSDVCSMVCAFAWHITTAAGAKHRHAWPWWGLLSHNWLRSCPSLHKEDFVHRLLRFAGLCPQPAASRTLVDFTTLYCSTWRRGTAADKPLLGCPALAALALALRSLFQFGHVARCPML
jgi:hypothetical protein